jgi:hypothetical protein
MKSAVWDTYAICNSKIPAVVLLARVLYSLAGLRADLLPTRSLTISNEIGPNIWK